MARILVVDDEESNRALLQIYLARPSYGSHNVSTAENAFSALEMINAAIVSGKPFNLVISDVNMPNMNGDELVRRVIKEIVPAPAFILVSGNLPPQGWTGLFLSKPFNLNKLAELVKSVLGRSRTPPRTSTPPPSAPSSV